MRDESIVERTLRAVNHMRLALLSGYTTYRDLGTEGLASHDASLREQSIGASRLGRVFSSQQAAWPPPVLTKYARKTMPMV